MIAICPACHDAVHHGTLKKFLYRWKGIKRTPPKGDHIYIEPGNSSKLLIGSIAVTGPSGLTVFELSSTNKLSFRIVDGDIFLVNLRITTVAGQEVIRVMDNSLKPHIEGPLKYNRRPGKIRITAPVDPDFLPIWALKALRVQEPNYPQDRQLILLDIEVIELGLVRVQGIWAENRIPTTVTGYCASLSKPPECSGKTQIHLLAEGVLRGGGRQSSVPQVLGQSRT